MREANSTVNTEAERLQRTRYYMGGYWTFLATAQDTNGQFSLIEMNLRKGVEPPAHTHTIEDESFHVLEGEVIFTAGGQEYHLRSGGFLHLPKGVQHSFKLLSEKAKVLMHLVPAGLEAMFMELSRPADSLEYPPAPVGPPPAEWLLKAAALQQQYGIVGMDNTKVKTS
jgi:quercetin dioxygenase-like cupin family protein